MSLSGLATHTAPSPVRTVAAPGVTLTLPAIVMVCGFTRTTRHCVHPGPSVTSHTPPSPAPTLPSPSRVAGTGSATCAATRLRAASILASPGVLHVAVQTAPNPTSLASQGPSRTAMVAVRWPLSGSSRYTAASPLSQTPPAPAASQSPLMASLAPPACSISVAASGDGVLARVTVAVAASRDFAADPSLPPHPALENSSIAAPAAARHPALRFIVSLLGRDRSGHPTGVASRVRAQCRGRRAGGGGLLKLSASPAYRHR